MANQYTTIGRRMRLGIVSGLLLASVGCGFSHGRYASDPMLGNFNRPIAATPPIFTGGDPGVSPAYDGGVRLGLNSPDVPTPQKQSDEHLLIMPTYQGSIGIGNIFKSGGSSGAGSMSGGSSGRFTTPIPTGGGGGGAGIFNRSGASGSTGARLPTAETELDKTTTYVPGMVTPLSGSAIASSRPRDVNSIVNNGSSISADIPTPKADPIRVALANPQQVATIEEAQALLTTCGAKTQALEQTPTGEWRFACTLGDGVEYRRYEAKHHEPIEAVRAVLIQVSGDK